MTHREFYLQRQRAELPAFMRSLSAGQIVWLLTGELKIGLDAVANYREVADSSSATHCTRCCRNLKNGFGNCWILSRECPDRHGQLTGLRPLTRQRLVSLTVLRCSQSWFSQLRGSALARHTPN